MKMSEYKRVRNMTYLKYCDYLQDKYGIGRDDYYTPAFSKKRKVTRTADGLVAHHKMEDHMILLSTKEVAMMCPYEWQQKENIVYCDYLEHLLLHVLICKYPANERAAEMDVGYGGITAFIVPELNDLYSGWETKQTWRRNCHEKVAEDEEVYLAILEQFIDIRRLQHKSVDVEQELCTSFNERYGAWSKQRNKKIFDKICNLPGT